MGKTITVFGKQVDLVPILYIPMERRMQTIMVMAYTALFVVAPLSACLIFLAVLFSPFFWVALGYLAWEIYDNTVHSISSRGGRRWERLRKASAFGYMRDFFPVHLVKTADLDPGNNYVIGYHPHGILGCGAFCNFATDATGFSRLFPGITPHILTLKANFIWPVLRGFLLWMGACDVSKQSIQWILTKQGAGNAAIIVVGGAEESLHAKPGTYKLTLKKRKGFVKAALRAGAHLVPVYSFGEADLFRQADNPEGSKLRKFQETFKRLFGFAPPLFHGRGVFNYSFGLLPFRKPIHTVVGRAIPVPRTSEPTAEQIDKIHQQYMDSLGELFEEHKLKYGVPETAKLEFI